MQGNLAFNKHRLSDERCACTAWPGVHPAGHNGGDALHLRAAARAWYQYLYLKDTDSLFQSSNYSQRLEINK
jgi:hypothetical protein